MTNKKNDVIVKEKLKQFLIKTASDMLKISDLDIDKEMDLYGFDSISYTDLANKINNTFKIDLLPTIFFDFEEPTINTLLEYIISNYKDIVTRYYVSDDTDNVKSKKLTAASVTPVHETAVSAEKKAPVTKKATFEMASRFITGSSNSMENVSRFIHPDIVEEKIADESNTGILNEPIAIIGMSGRFPHSANIKEYWENIYKGKNLIGEVPEDRFDWHKFTDPCLRWGCFMDDIDIFDAKFFGITDPEADAIDPQHRLFLENTWSALEDAGYRPSSLSGTKTGVFIGIGTRDYSEMMDRYAVEDNSFFLSGRSPFMLSNRISSTFNLTGPCEAIDTACSSSLVAVHKAVESIHIGSSEMAIVGGVNLILTPSVHQAFSAAGMLTESGEVRVFDKDADGTVRSEGVGVIILKPLSAAVKDNDHIYALIKSTAQNHKGKSASLTSPKASAEADLIMEAFHKADIDPSTVNYIEAHSTGAKLGDPVEIVGLKKAFKTLYDENGLDMLEGQCSISSLKSSFGHLETAAGIASLIKAVLAINHKLIPGIKNFTELNPYINLSDSVFCINNENKEWKRVADDIPRRVGISAFGYGGVNAHVILEEYDNSTEIAVSSEYTYEEPAIILLSAHTQCALKKQAESLLAYVREENLTDDRLADIAYTLQIGRESFEERLAFTVTSIADLTDTLEKFINNEPSNALLSNKESKNGFVTMIENDSEIIDMWFERKNYDKLMNLWLYGSKVDWEKMYEGMNVHRISLPTYPFEGKRHWLNFIKEKEPDKVRASGTRKVKKVKKVKNKPVKAVTVDSKQLFSIEEIEKNIRKYCEEVIGNDDFTLDDGFFDMGVDSTTAADLTALINQIYACDITVTDLFEHSNLRKLCKYVSEKSSSVETKASSEEEKIEIVEYYEDEDADYDNCVAVIGISCEVPGADSYEKFWENLVGNKECSKYLSREEQIKMKVPKDIIDNPHYVPVQFAVSEKDVFDPGFFKISPRDAEFMDPQLRHLLQESWKAVEDAGYIAADIPNTAVYMSASNNHYYNLERREENGEADIIENTDSYVKWLYSLNGTLPTMISYKLGLKGPAYFVHSNCSSGLVAMYQAYTSICQGKVDYALVGASTMHCTENVGYMHFPGLNTSSDGHVKTFDTLADGMVDGEGAAVILMKNAKKAIADGDHIYAVLRGIELNNDGSDKVGFYAPSVTGQTSVILSALKNTGVEPETIDFVEAHGTGTKLGDPIEFNAISDAYRKYTDKKNFCGIGSVKTNIGHLDTVAGIIGSIKLMLSLHNGIVPASLNYHKPNPELNIENSPFYVISDNLVLEKREAPHRAALSSLGIGGTNAHAIFEEYRREVVMNEEPDCKYIIPVSAKTPDRLREYADKLFEYLENNSGDMLNMRNISYTMQTGRTPMKKRIAFVADSLEDLKNKLKGYAENRASGYYEKKDDYNTYYTDEQKAELFSSGKVEELAKYWVNGGDVNWQSFYDDIAAYKVSLPVYPFAKEHYWKSDESHAAKNAAGTSKVINPLIDENISDFVEQKYTKCFSEKDCYLSDHVVNGKMILPGVAHIEMARSACENAMKKPVSVMKNIVWMRSIEVENEKQVDTALSVNGDAVSYQIRSGEEENVIYSQGSVQYTDEYNNDNDEYIDIKNAFERGQTHFTGEEFYTENNNSIFLYKKTYQALKEVSVNNNEVVGIIELPVEREADLEAFVLHPSLLEGSLHVTGTLMHKKGMKPFLPFTIERIEIKHKLEKRCFVYATYSYDNSKDIQNDKFNIWITDENGRVLVKIYNYSIRLIDTDGHGEGSIPGQPSLSYLKEEWKYKEPVCEQKKDFSTVLIFDKGDELSRKYKKILPDHARLIHIRSGYKEFSFKDYLAEINANDEENYFILMKTLKSRNINPDRIVFDLDTVCGGADRNIDNTICSFSMLMKALISEFSKSNISIIALNDNIGGIKGVAAQAVSGFINTIAQEYPKYHLKYVELRTSKVYKEEIIDYEFCIDNSEEVRYTSDGRFVKTITLCTAEGSVDTSMRNNGVYLITGGQGRIAANLAEYLAEKYASRIALIGRSPKNSDTDHLIRRIQTAGGDAIYIQADCTDSVQMRNAVNEVISQYSDIHGVFHCAGIISDKMLVNKTIADIKNVVSVKANGAVNLYEALKNVNTDFICFFSSIAYLGSVGQSDYSYANCFLNKYAEYCADIADGRGKIVSVCWPLWENGGMKMNAVKINSIKEKHGMYPLTDEAGMAALERCISGHDNVVIVLYGDDNIMSNRSEMIS